MIRTDKRSTAGTTDWSISFTKILENMAGCYDNNSMTNSPSMTIAQKINKLLFQLLLLVPILFVTNTKELFEFPKTTALYVVGCSISLLFILEKLGKRQKIVLPNKFVSLFVLANIISTIFSSHRYTSLWGYYSRFNGGLFSTLTFFGVYIYLINNKEILKKSATQIPIFTTLPIGAYAVFQHFSGVERAHSTLGQPNWLAAYVVMVIPSILKDYFDKKNKRNFVPVFYIVAFSALWFTYSLSGIAAFLVSTAILFFQNRHIPKPKLLLITTVSIVIALSNLGIFKDRLHDLFVDFGKVKASSEYTLSDPGYIRTAVWEGTLKLAASNLKTLSIGTGPETFPYEFPKFRPEKLNFSSEWDFIINKPHNFYLEVLSETGLFGLISYLLLLAHFFKNAKNKYKPAIVGFAVTNIWGWPVVATALLFWVGVGIGMEPGKIVEIKTNKASKFVLGVFAWIFVSKAVFLYQADVEFVKSLNALSKYELETSMEKILNAIRKNPDEPNYYKQRARIYIADSVGQDKGVEGNLKHVALNDLEKAISLNPKNLATQRDILPLYFFAASKDLTSPAGNSNIDKEFLPTTVDYFNKVKSDHPTDAGALVDVAKYENRLNLPQFENTKRQIEKLRPDLILWHESLR